MEYLRDRYSVSGAELCGRKFEPRGFDSVDTAEAYYREIMATVPVGYVVDLVNDVLPRRSYKVCPKCGGLDTVHSSLSVDGRSWTCRACGYRLVMIDNKADLRYLAERLGVLEDWHEPDNQGVTIRFGGTRFDNAGHWPDGFGESADKITEHYIVIMRDGEDVAAVNVATLFAMAARR